MNAATYFTNYFLEESLLLRFHYNSIKDEVIIVFDLADRTLSKPVTEVLINPEREFHEVIFNDVSNYTREAVGKVFQDSDKYIASENRVSACIYNVTNIHSNNGFEFKASFGAFGNISIKYKSLFYKKKIVTSKKDSKGKYNYLDIKNNNIVDFYDPFAY